jgi:hypothetical protein
MMIFRRNRKGMSLVEIMGAVFVMSFAILAVASIFPAGLQMNRKTKIRIQALEMATGVMEEIRNLPYYDTSKTCIISLADPNGDYAAGWSSFTIGHTYGTTQWTPSIVSNSSGPNKIGVTDSTSPVFFRARDLGDTRSLTLFQSGVNNANIKLPAIHITPLAPNNATLYKANYGGVSKSRIHKIVVTSNIEEFVAGKARYSIIQVTTYRGDGLTMTPGN